MSLLGHQYRKPSVYVTQTDYERLSNLADSVDTRGAHLLAEELERAIVISDDDFPRAFVRLHSKVEFSDLTTDRTWTVEIVAPDEADIDRSRLSVLSPVGAALIGLPVGESIGLEAQDGRAQVLVVKSVEPALELA